MMHRLSLGIACAFAAALIGCNDETLPAAPGGGGSGTGGTIVPGTGGSGGSGAGGTGGAAATGGSGTAGSGGSGMGGNGGVGGVIASGACDNTADVTALSALADLLVQNARQLAATCAITDPECSSAPDPDSFTQCVTDCVVESAGLSVECATCYGELALCSGLSCNTPCANDSCDLECENESNCAGGTYAECFNALDACASRPSRDCPGDT